METYSTHTRLHSSSLLVLAELSVVFNIAKYAQIAFFDICMYLCLWCPDTAWIHDGHGRDMDFIYKKWSIGYETTQLVVHFEASVQHRSLWVSLQYVWNWNRAWLDKLIKRFAVIYTYRMLFACVQQVASMHLRRLIFWILWHPDVVFVNSKHFFCIGWKG